ncbi:MAG: glycine dehydrogenase (aminomethyl-transferring), partial [Meiothermus ruber]|nr:glycine dehydrogenase (aminomethyl-transferring) [Meiothermus ruber]
MTPERKPRSTDFSRRHIGPTPADIEQMLQAVGVSSLEELIQQTVPASIREAEPLNIGPGLSETEMLARMRAIASKNQVFTSLIGQGYYGTILPPVIQRNL